MCLNNRFFMIYIQINKRLIFVKMKNLVLACFTVFTTISLMTSCGEKTATENATPNATPDVVADSTVNATDVVKADTTKK